MFVKEANAYDERARSLAAQAKLTNVIDLLEAVGSPDDDGYLASSRGQQAILFTTNAQSFADFYNISMVNPFNYSVPRQIRLGIRLGL